MAKYNNEAWLLGLSYNILVKIEDAYSINS